MHPCSFPDVGPQEQQTNEKKANVSREKTFHLNLTAKSIRFLRKIFFGPKIGRKMQQIPGEIYPLAETSSFAAGQPTIFFSNFHRIIT